MSFSSYAGADIISGSITIPYWGAISADVGFTTTSSVNLTGTLIIGDLSYKCTVFRSSEFGGSRTARLVGGYGGWRKNIPTQGYNLSSGVKASLVLGDCANIVGEQVTVVTDRSLGQQWAREEAPASRTLKQIAGIEWWVEPSGVTRVGPRTNLTQITSPFEVLARTGGKGTVTIATEIYADWTPGRTFLIPGSATPVTISAVILTLGEGGKARLEVLTYGAENES